MYGENGGQLRTALTTLLRQHRVQQRLGGKGLHTFPETTTVEEREALGEQIRRYRQTVLVWCLEAVQAANPRINLVADGGGSTAPSEELRRRLTTAVEASDAKLPSLEQLTTAQPFPMVETWRLAARAAALGEHDFGAGVGYGHLSERQCLTVLKDAAEITRGIVALDRRYTNVPGWRPLKNPGRLRQAAEAYAGFAGHDDPDYTVDLRGWRPPAELDHGPRRPGIAGILQGEYNLLVELKRFPDAHSLRLVLDSQRIVSHETSRRVRRTGRGLPDKWERRARTYKTLIDETRNIRGRLGNGGPAAAQAAIVAARAQSLPLDAPVESTALGRLDRLFARIDARLGDVIEHGAAQRLYFLRVKLPRIVDRADNLVQPARTRYVPIDSPVQTDLLRIVRFQLRPRPARPRAPDGAGRSRAEFEAAIQHQPERRGSIGL